MSNESIKTLATGGKATAALEAEVSELEGGQTDGQTDARTLAPLALRRVLAGTGWLRSSCNTCAVYPGRAASRASGRGPEVSYLFDIPDQVVQCV